MDKRFWVGVDVGKSSFCAAIVSCDADVGSFSRLPVQSFVFSSSGMDDFVSWVRTRVADGSVEGICIESTGRLGWRWMSALCQDAWPVAMVNPSKTRAFGQSLGVREKTDELDARVLALYGSVMGPQPTGLPSPQLLELRELNRLFMALSRDKQSYENRLLDGPTSSLVRRELKRAIQALERRMQSVQAHMDDIIEQNAALKNDVDRITSIKGVGPRTAYVLLAELGDLRQYRRNELASFAGLFPRKYESGSSVYRKPRLVKRGAAPVRKALYWCAMSARTHNPQMRSLYERQIARGKSPKAALGILMRKLLLLARSLLVHQTNYDPKYA